VPSPHAHADRAAWIAQESRRAPIIDKGQSNRFTRTRYSAAVSSIGSFLALDRLIGACDAYLDMHQLLLGRLHGGADAAKVAAAMRAQDDILSAAIQDAHWRLVHALCDERDT
jgi:hypothetical protein